MSLSEFGKNFLCLALRINKHINGYVDFYIGPKDLRQLVENEVISSPKKILDDCKTLQKEIFKQGYDKKRESYIEKLLKAMETSIEILNGTEIPIKEEFFRTYDVVLQPVKESELNKLKDEFNAAYGGFESLEKRMNEIRILRTVPEQKVYNLFKKALNITRERTKELFINLLPSKEHINLELTKKNKDEIKWAYYNWYEGKFCSRIEVNPNYNMYWTAFLFAAAHEGYPGHHTEFAIKEKVLCGELNQFEHSILLLHSPKLIISEGIADLALNVLFSDQKAVEISLRELCPDSSKEASFEMLIAQNKIRGKISLFWYTLAYHAHIDRFNYDELLKYGLSFEIFSEESIKNQLKRISNPIYSKNAFMYSLGSNLIKRKYGESPSVKNFQHLLAKPLLPSDLI